MRRLMSLMWAASLMAATFAAGQTVTDSSANDWINQRVITHFGTVLKVKGEVVDDENREQTSRGGERREVRVDRVKAVNGPWLWLVQEGGSASGWVKTDQVVPYDQATDYVTFRIRSNPGDSILYQSREILWKEKGEYDIAISDYNEAIRLDPANEVSYNNRGNAWFHKAEYDRAIADYSEAI
ncbi:tetratricopeptide repeat protein [Tautonia rosea]|uniref:tetratricopeptide repeat protein n=1 Tax=Tautonia rosea TaxID=2728037 RepID=UPI001474F3F5|nr:tetratricopeptide repeat protein [Tautonia rosea]